ncbi:uncharacterized protein LOC130645523 isoform X2 [Hydractinia symbiolongicarpus]|uniref:uncharacterized protein LOC130645523 isoform X2 n=1 Tax=Hydractinia symbiolongicarpus TaxID=13093 RepID=UPI00254D21B9|nr:uncharacterized protein LOC130645523 isoform X2 [Hydractinia symbiolongicarpus]
MKQMSGCDRKYGRQSDVVVRSELDSLQRKCFHSIPDQTGAASINLVEGSFGSQVSSLSTNEDPRFSFNKKISLMDLPHPSKLQAQAHESRKHPQKKYSVVESYLQQLKRKQSEFNWISEDEGCNKENIPQNQSGCSYIEQDPFHAVLLPFGALPAIRSSTVERSSVVLKDVKHFCCSNAQTSWCFNAEKKILKITNHRQG